jgi:3'(2'), 5'-bisphosphate nucleotidase
MTNDALYPVTLRQAVECARAAALEAWAAISHFHGGGYEIEHKPDGPSTEADKLADRIIVEALRRRYPPREYGYLSEEFVRDPIRLERRAVWIIDPIDGTRDFIRGSLDFAMQIGLVIQEGEVWLPAVGVVYHPLAGRMYWAVRGAGAFVEEELAAEQTHCERWWARRPEEPPRPIESARFHAPVALKVSGVRDIEKMTAVVSASHRTRRLLRVLEIVPFARHYSRGSVGVKIAEIAAGKAEVYVNTERGHCKEWDLCGPHLILTESGGRLTTLDGEAISYNREDVRLHGGILASNGPAHESLLEAISPLTT